MSASPLRDQLVLVTSRFFGAGCVVQGLHRKRASSRNLDLGTTSELNHGLSSECVQAVRLARSAQAEVPRRRRTSA
eukprot:9467528-Pyramimonas_sp.AAC.1